MTLWETLVGCGALKYLPQLMYKKQKYEKNKLGKWRGWVPFNLHYMRLNYSISILNLESNQSLWSNTVNNAYLCNIFFKF